MVVTIRSIITWISHHKEIIMFCLCWCFASSTGQHTTKAAHWFGRPARVKGRSLVWKTNKGKKFSTLALNFSFSISSGSGRTSRKHPG